MAEYALSGIDKPIGVAEYQLLRELPDALEKSLPTIAEIEAEMAGEQSEAAVGSHNAERATDRHDHYRTQDRWTG